MQHDGRLAQLARTIGATQTARLEQLKRPSLPQFATPEDKLEAKRILTEERVNSKSYKDPAKQKRRVFRSKEKNEALANPETWSFSANERALVLDRHIRTLGPVGVAHAIIELDQAQVLDANILPIDENKRKSKDLSQRPAKHNDWLEFATQNDSLPYIALLSSRGAHQNAKDRALAVALANQSWRAVRELLQYEADPNAHTDQFFSAIQDGNMQLVELFLSAPKTLWSTHVTRGLIEASSKGQYEILSLLLAYEPDKNHQGAEALRAAVFTQNLLITAAILLNSSSSDISPEYLDRSVSEACKIPDEKLRAKFLELILCAGATSNTPLLQYELFCAVKNNNVDLVRLLVLHGTSPNQNDAEGVRWTIRNINFELLDLLLQGHISSTSASKALDEIPNQISEQDFQKILKLLIGKKIEEEALSRCLVRVINNGFYSTITTLIEGGASLDYDEALSVRLVLQGGQLEVLEYLLRGKSSSSILSKALPDAMAIRPNTKRQQVVVLLLKKGVSGRELHVALQTAVTEAVENYDNELISVLLQHKASVDFADSNGNCIQIAAKHGNLKVLEQLCSAEPSLQTTSPAVPLAFATLKAGNYSEVLAMISLLMYRKAQGTPVAETLVEAIRLDDRLHIVDILLKNGADINYQEGKAIEKALDANNPAVLELVCNKGRIERESLARILPKALDPRIFNLLRVRPLIKCATKFRSILDQALLTEVETRGARLEVIELLLEHGASVNFKDGAVLARAVHLDNLEILQVLVGGKPERVALTTALKASMELDAGRAKYAMVQVLVGLGEPGIGQDEALMRAVERDPADVEIPRLLLEHGASVDANSGQAMQLAAESGAVPLIKLFIAQGPSRISYLKAFQKARKASLSSDQRFAVFELLLPGSIESEEASEALVEAVAKESDGDLALHRLLLANGASVNFGNGQSMKAAVKSGNVEMLNLLMSGEPNSRTLEAAFLTARQTDMSTPERIGIYECLLQKKKITQDQVSASLLEAIAAGPPDQALLRLLLKYNASVDFNGGEALCTASMIGDSTVLGILLEGTPPQKGTFNRAFMACFELPKEKRSLIARMLLQNEHGVSANTISLYLKRVVRDGDHELLRAMLDRGGDPLVNSGENIILASEKQDPISVGMLTAVNISADIASKAFQRMLDGNLLNNQQKNIQTAEILLMKGADSTLVDRALLQQFGTPAKGISKNVVELLLRYGANVDANRGQCLITAASVGDIDLFKLLAKNEMSLDSIIPPLIESVKNEKLLVELLGICFETPSSSGVVDGSMLFTAMKHFPRGALLVKLLLDHGCLASATCQVQLDEEFGPETATALLWALSQPRPGVSDSVIFTLLEAGANPQFVAPNSGLSAATMAAKGRRSAVMLELAKLDIDVSSRDAKNRSPLFYTSRNGDLEMARLLVYNQSLPDDGSLHEAAREAHPEMVSFLLQNGHNVKYPSSEHADGAFGRTALQELCLKSEPNGEGWKMRIRRTIGHLLSADSEIALIKRNGKSVLHLALDNEHAFEVTSALLEFAPIWEAINESVHRFEDKTGVIYSPTMYVSHFYEGARDGMRTQLIRLLHGKQCEDRLYRQIGEQPEGAVGLPDDVAAAVDRQRRAAWELAEELRREDERVAHRRRVEADDHRLAGRFANDRHEQAMRQAQAKETFERETIQHRQAMALTHQRAMNQDQQMAISAESKLRLQFRKDETAQTLALQNSEREHRRLLLLQDKNSEDAKVGRERRLLEDREGAMKREHERQMVMIERQDQSVRMRANEIRGVAEAARGLNMPRDMLRLGYNETPD